MKVTQFIALTFCSIITFSGCYKDDEYNVKDEVQANPAITGFYSTDFTLDGTVYSWKDGDKTNAVTTNYSGTVTSKLKKKAAGDTTINAFGDTLVHITMTLAANYSSTFTALNSKEKLLFTTDTIPFSDSYDSLYNRPSGFRVVNAGPYVFGSSAPPNVFYDLFYRPDPVPFLSATTNGIAIAFMDKDGVLWTSASGAQTTPSFKMTNVEKGSLANGITFAKGDLDFSCTIYNAGIGKAISGKAKLYFVNSR